VDRTESPGRGPSSTADDEAGRDDDEDRNEDEDENEGEDAFHNGVCDGSVAVGVAGAGAAICDENGWIDPSGQGGGQSDGGDGNKNADDDNDDDGHRPDAASAEGGGGGGGGNGGGIVALEEAPWPGSWRERLLRALAK